MSADRQDTAFDVIHASETPYSYNPLIWRTYIHSHSILRTAAEERSPRLIIRWSQVRVLPGPPKFSIPCQPFFECAKPVIESCPPARPETPANSHRPRTKYRTDGMDNSLSSASPQGPQAGVDGLLPLRRPRPCVNACAGGPHDHTPQPIANCRVRLPDRDITAPSASRRSGADSGDLRLLVHALVVVAV